jgi:hypothetical protein
VWLLRFYCLRHRAASGSFEANRASDVYGPDNNLVEKIVETSGPSSQERSVTCS